MLETSNENGKLTKTTADMLRTAFAYGRELPRHEKQALLAFCLAYQLDGCDRERAERICNSLLAGLTAITKGDVVAQEMPMSVEPQVKEQQTSRPLTAKEAILQARTKQILQDTIVKINGESLDLPSDIGGLLKNLEQGVGDITTELYELTGTRKFLSCSLKEIIQQLKEKLQDNDDAIKRSAKESFDRLLLSVNPQTAKSYVSGASMKIGPFYKSALFDAACEKYEQLMVYHEKGRLVRDFNAMYKSHLKLLAKEKPKK